MTEDDKTCQNCERYKLSASMWRHEAYKQGGTPLPWEPEVLLRREYERGFLDGIKQQLKETRREVGNH